MPCPSDLQNYKWKFPKLLNPEFQLFMTDGSRVMEKGCNNTFEWCHTLLSCRNSNNIKKATYILSFKSLGQKISCISWLQQQHDNDYIYWEAALLPEWQRGLKVTASWYYLCEAHNCLEKGRELWVLKFIGIHSSAMLSGKLILRVKGSIGKGLKGSTEPVTIRGVLNSIKF